jgi:hypothetical protein
LRVDAAAAERLLVDVFAELFDHGRPGDEERDVFT